MAWESRAAYGRDRSRSPKLTSWGLCRYDCEQLLFQNNSAVSMLLSKSRGMPALPCLRLLILRDRKPLLDLPDFLRCVLSEEALHIGRKLP